MTNSTPKIWAVVPAAGTGSRMQSDIPKQYLSVAGKTILEHSVETLFAHANIAQLVICVAKEDTSAQTIIQNNHILLEQYSNGHLRIVTGGATRAHSVLNGIDSFASQIADDDWLLVHDAARPCVTSDDITTLLKSIRNDAVGGLLAARAKDTLKVADDKRAAHTLDRETIWHAYTPQVFRYAKLAHSLKSAIQQGLTITDEASAMELAGHSPLLVEGSTSNIKVTTNADLMAVEHYLGASRA